MAEIRLSGVNKIYPGGTHAVHDVDLHIADGEFMIMVGPSGCAKSTILRMIAGLEQPSSGTVEIGGRVVNDVAPKDRDIAMVFQSYALYPHMTVRDNMAFGLRLRRMPQHDIDQRVDEAARILGLEQLLDRLPKAMSGGQRQRVAMGRAIVREPQAFLMDEPLSNLDAKLRVQMRTEIAKLHQRLGVTTVYVTHDQVEAMTLGQRICILRKGVVQQIDTPFQVYQNPANVFVGGFIGSPGMNFMSGTLATHDGHTYLQLGNQHLALPASVAARLRSDSNGRRVIVGIRPEHLSIGTPESHDVIPVQVELTEAMGNEVYAYFTANVDAPDLSAFNDTQATSDSFVARLPVGSGVANGATIGLRPNLEEVHLFDPQSMLTLLEPIEESHVRARQAAAAGDASIVVHAPTPAMSPAPSPAPQPPHARVAVPMPRQLTPHGHLPHVDHERIASVFDAAQVPHVAQSSLMMPIDPLMPVAANGFDAFAASTPAPSLQPAQPPAPIPMHAAPLASAPAQADALVERARPSAPHGYPRPSFTHGMTAGSTLDDAATFGAIGRHHTSAHSHVDPAYPAGWGVQAPAPGVATALGAPLVSGDDAAAPIAHDNVAPRVVPALDEPAPAPAAADMQRPARRGFAPRPVGAPAAAAVARTTVHSDDVAAAADTAAPRVDVGADAVDEAVTWLRDATVIETEPAASATPEPAFAPFRSALRSLRGSTGSPSTTGTRDISFAPPSIQLSPYQP